MRRDDAAGAEARSIAAGTSTKKAQRQASICAKAPPMAGPISVETPQTLEIKAKARPHRCCGKASRIMA